MGSRRRAAKAPASVPVDAGNGARGEEWHERWESAEVRLRERFEEPVERATRITRRTMAWFPVRVWRRFLQHDGFLLAAGVSYQSLFAIFAAIYLVFALVGIWLGGSTQAVDRLISLINDYIPGLISDHGLIKPEQVHDVAASSTSLLSITGGIAVVVVVWTAIGFVTFARRAVRNIFGLPYDRRSYVLLKARDLLAAFAYGVSLLVGAALGQVGTWALHLVFRIFGWDVGSEWFNTLVRVLTLLVAFGINAVALAFLFRLLTGTSLRWERIWPGSLVGGAAIVVLQIGAGFLLSYTPSNPLLATFAIFIGFLLWFRLNGIVLLVTAAWIAVATLDRDLPLVEVSAEDRAAAEQAALLTAARVRLREAQAEAASAPWWRRVPARAAVTRAERALAEVTSAPVGSSAGSSARSRAKSARAESGSATSAPAPAAPDPTRGAPGPHPRENAPVSQKRRP
ncbi:YihY/virulence factor BrkB family protein [Microbacterium sp. X-17]|uniref:YihY/virulence factor BrkB family protein n=1 Tax=Microbacterium sp. X-17 TaxID=3144404 RepID=UPI0031F589CB